MAFHALAAAALLLAGGAAPAFAAPAAAAPAAGCRMTYRDYSYESEEAARAQMESLVPGIEQVYRVAARRVVADPVFAGRYDFELEIEGSGERCPAFVSSDSGFVFADARSARASMQKEMPVSLYVSHIGADGKPGVPVERMSAFPLRAEVTCVPVERRQPLDPGLSCAYSFTLLR